MGTKIKEFRQYNNFIYGACQKRNQIKIQTVVSRNRLVDDRAIAYDDRIDIGIRYAAWTQGEIISGLYPDRTADVYAVFTVNDVCLKVHPSE